MRAPPAVEARQVMLAGAQYDVVLVDLRRAEVRLYWQDEHSQGIGTFARLGSYLRDHGQTLLAATNAGIFEPGYVPTGLHIERKQELPMTFSQDTYQKALRFAAEVHCAQMVPGGQLPYVVHLASVAMEVLAAAMHDPFDADLAVTCTDKRMAYREEARAILAALGHTRSSLAQRLERKIEEYGAFG